MKFKLLISISIILCSPVVAWDDIFGRSEYAEYFSDMACLADGNYILVGELHVTYMEAPYPYCGYLVKITPDGDQLLDRIYGTDGNTRFNAVAPLPDSGFVVVGDSWTNFATPTGDQDIFMMKCDSYGETLWVKTYGTDSPAQGNAVALTDDGGFMIVGAKKDTLSAITCYYIIKTDSTGDILWTREYTYGSDARPKFIIKTPDDRFAVGGSVYDAHWKGLLFKIDSLGAPIWHKIYSAPTPEKKTGLSDIVITSDGGFALTGYIVVDEYDTTRWYFIKTDAEGDTVFTRHYFVNSASAIAKSGDNGYLLAGPALFSGFRVLRIDEIGDSLWTKSYQYEDTVELRSYRPHSILPTENGGYLLGGYSDYFSFSLWYRLGDFYVVMIDSLGNLAPDNIAEQQKLPQAFTLSAFPNPFNSAVSIAAPMGAEIEIFDVNGRMVYNNSVGEGLVPSRTTGDHKGLPYETVWHPDASLGSGVYLIRAKVGEKEVTKRVVYLR